MPKNKELALQPSDNSFQYLFDIIVDISVVDISLKEFIKYCESDRNALGNVAAEARKLSETGLESLVRSAVISTYTIMEACIKDMIVAIFKEMGEDLLDIEEVRGLNISLVEYSMLDEEERFDYLFSEYEKKVARGERYGISRFEKLLQPIRLSGLAPKDLEQQILELAQMRNCLIHRNGIVDRQFLRSCGWLKNTYSIGDSVHVDREGLSVYIQSVMQYVRIVEERLKDVYPKLLGEIEFS